MNPPPNPSAAECAAAVMAYNAMLWQEAQPAPYLYPLADPRPIWRYVANDAGVDVVCDDPASLFGGE